MALHSDPCNHEDTCPWGVRPSVGMWARVGDHQFWGTNCICYLDCPRAHYTEQQWTANAVAHKLRQANFN